MFTLPLLSLIVVALPALGQTINLQDGIHNSTSIQGTWTTGSGAVLTGINSANPVNMSFNYPKNTGRSFSFTDAGNWEQFDYRMASNATDPHCITAVLTWQHGSFEFLPNGSLQLTPFEGDGFQQVQSRCAAFSSPINRYNQPILFKEWRIFPLPQGGVHLNLYEFDGTPVAPMTLAANPPNMLPTTTLVATATATASSTGAKRDLASSATKSMSLMLGGVGTMAGLGAMLVLL